MSKKETDTGVCLWLTGRSGAGKSTVTDLLVPMFESIGRRVTVLDTVPALAKTPGETSSEGKLLRKAFVASEVVRHGGVVICVTVSARRAVRDQARQVVGSEHFVEVYFDLPAEVAESRRRQRGSRRTLYRRMRNALRPLARSVSDRPGGGYEPPPAPEVTIDAEHASPQDGARQIFDALRSRGFVSG